jgi:hypothetical protein
MAWVGKRGFYRTVSMDEKPRKKNIGQVAIAAGVSVAAISRTGITDPWRENARCGPAVVSAFGLVTLLFRLQPCNALLLLGASSPSSAAK